jgi:hypothetical protein
MILAGQSKVGWVVDRTAMWWDVVLEWPPPFHFAVQSEHFDVSRFFTTWWPWC